MKYPTDNIRVLLVDEHRLVRSAIRCLIETFDNMAVVAEAGSAHELLAVLACREADVALVDAAIASSKELESLTRLREVHPGLQVVVLSAYSSDTYIRRLFREGVCGFLHKNADVHDLETAIHKAVQGERFVLTAMEPEQFINAASVVGEGSRQETPLTPRQSEVLRLVATGFRNKAIADQLNVSVKTIETHRAHIMRRLGVGHTAGLVHEAIRLGLISQPQTTDLP
ncbi:hypothetical protein BWR19_12445 [Halomonas sp. 1513]|nr:response regulator transcription factor [Halomonas sp. 1513]APX93679.1 hypothetical protein BWR19_12445 [Halomonas sp. 1513]